MMVCVLFTLSAVSAADNQTDVISDEGDSHTFTDLKNDLNNSGDVFEVQHNYKYCDDDNFIGRIIIEKNMTINGNDHVIENLTGKYVLVFDSTGNINVNNLTFKNCFDASIMINSNVVFNNVQFINCSGFKQTGDIYVEDNFIQVTSKDMTFNNCVFQMNPGNYSAIVCNYGSLTVNNSLFNKGDFLKGCLFVNRADFIVENTTFANMSSSFATAINYKAGILQLETQNSLICIPV